MPAVAQTSPPPAELVTKATERFKSGQRLYGEKKYEEALTELRASYDAVNSPNSRLYIARCLRELGRRAAAYEEYGHVIIEAADRSGSDKKYAQTLRAATDERAALKSQVGMVKITVPAGAEVTSVRIGAEDVPAARWGQEVAADVGAATVRAEAPGRPPFEKTIEVKAGRTQEIVVELAAITTAEPAPSSPEPSPGAGSTSERSLLPFAIASGGVGVAGLALWGIFGVKASSRYDDLERTCGGRCGPAYQGDVDAGRRETAASTAGLVIGIVGIAGGAALLAIDLTSKGKTEGEGGVKAALRVVPGPAGPFVSVGGAF